MDVTYLPWGYIAAAAEGDKSANSRGGGEYISSRSGDGKLSPEILPLEPKPTPLAEDMREGRRGNAERCWHEVTS
jgi:hypothetical protein